MRVIDVFPFFDEIDLLLIRLRYLSPTVDLFLISEYDTSFSGKHKGYILEKNWEIFEQFHHKIHYVKQTQKDFFTSFENDRFQKDSIKSHLQRVANNEDFILFGDLDEIPRIETINVAKNLKRKHQILHFAQDAFSVYLNLKETSGTLLSHAGEYPGIFRKKWIGTVGVSLETVKFFSMTELRDPERKGIGKRMANAGWHFSYAGGHNSDALDRLKFKLGHSAHQEFNNSNVVNSLESNLLALKDPFGRKPKRNKFGRINESKYVKKQLDKEFPLSLVTILRDFTHLILK